MSLRRIVLIAVALTTVVWAAGWGKRVAHLYGDPLLATWMIHAAETFADTGFAPYGLPVYEPGAPPYTHLTPGPEWIQTLFALLRRFIAPSVPPFLWHSMLTAVLSAAAMVALQRTVARLAGESASVAVLLLAATPSFVIYAPNPMCAATLLANVLTFAAVATWAASPREEQWPRALARIAAALFAAFWLGSLPLVSGAIWTFAAILCFGNRARRLRRAVTFALVNGIVLTLALALKFLQSLMHFGSVDSVLRDFRSVLAYRTGQTFQYPLTTQLRETIVACGYLFGIALLVLAILAWRSRSLVVRNGPFFAALIAGALAWQVVMRGHVMFHKYTLRELMVPIAFLIATLARPEDRRTIEWCALASILFVAAVLVVPLVIAGLPLWKL